MKADLLRITDIQRYSVHDGPGIRTVVFFKGCPLRCHWCQNPETQHCHDELGVFPDRCIGCGACLAACPNGAIFATEDGFGVDRERCCACGACAEVCHSDCRCLYGKTETVTDVLRAAVRDRDFFRNTGGGVTLSGGEPLSQADGAATLLGLLKSEGIHTAVETCGYGSGDDYLRILRNTDCVLFDVKLIDPARHRAFTGVDNEPILENLDRTIGAAACLIIRIPLIPGVNDDESNLKQTASRALRAGAREVHLLGFHQAGRQNWKSLGRPYRFADRKGADPDHLAAAKLILEASGLKVDVGGGGIA